MKETKGLDGDSGPKVEPQQGLTGGVSAAENFLNNSLSQFRTSPTLTHHDCVLLRTGWLVTRPSTVTTNILLSFPLVNLYLHEDIFSVDKVYFYYEGIFWK